MENKIKEKGKWSKAKSIILNYDTYFNIAYCYKFYYLFYFPTKQRQLYYFFLSLLRPFH